ncbi:uncharacterized protein LOC141812953 [Curcuma longa]|uniref:uncharacterized protein LOC141812953 n=1 Tax=Curcuma longa TaxID=136217 RepID=UPI003D9DD52C
MPPSIYILSSSFRHLQFPSPLRFPFRQPPMAVEVSAVALADLHASRSGLASLLRSTSDVETALSDFDARLSSHLYVGRRKKGEKKLYKYVIHSISVDASLSSHLYFIFQHSLPLSYVSDTVSPLQSHAVATRALRSRIDRAVSPALALLRAFSLVRSLQRRLLRLSPSPSDPATLIEYVDCVDHLTRRCRRRRGLLRPHRAAAAGGCRLPEPHQERPHTLILTQIKSTWIAITLTGAAMPGI